MVGPFFFAARDMRDFFRVMSATFLVVNPVNVLPFKYQASEDPAERGHKAHPHREGATQEAVKISY
jgi:hypothetical protein